MTSSILSRLETEINRYYENNVDMNIVKVFMSCSFYRDLLREFYNSYQHTGTGPMHYVQFTSLYGTVMIKSLPRLDIEHYDLMFELDNGDKIYPLDEEINRILLGY